MVSAKESEGLAVTVVSEPVLMTFGTDAFIERVLAAIADQEDSPGGALWGQLNEGDADAFRVALVDADRADLVEVFPAWRDFRVSAELAAVLFESLVDFALAEPLSDLDPARQDRAWSWAADIALSVAGVEAV